jgi:hypothetical protein
MLPRLRKPVLIGALSAHFTSAAPAPVLRELHVADDPSAWRAAGFCVDSAGVSRVGSVAVRLLGATGAGGRRGIVGWGMSSIAAATTTIDGIPCWRVDDSPVVAGGGAGTADVQQHPNGSAAVDHVVLRSDDWRRTDGELLAQGLVCRRRRDDIYPGITQLFYRDGGPIVELVAPTVGGGGGGRGAAEGGEAAMGQKAKAAAAAAAAVFGLGQGASGCTVWGLTLAVGDLDASKALLGDAASKVRNAKQPGRRIMTLRNRQLDISVNVAFISDHVAGAVPPPAKL